tara:strand:+ start:2459 stop:3499 length:1041 start_codon:yes stop_codon:yes gene_type:complete
MSYSEMAIPNRSEHQWRYTSWEKIHPSDVNSIPEIEIATVLLSEESISPKSKREFNAKADISRVFMQEVNSEMYSIKLDKSIDFHTIEINSNKPHAICHLNLVAESSTALQIIMSGECEWLGIHITGEIKQNCNLFVGVLNNLNSGCKLLRCEDWNIERDGSLTYGELSIGGNYAKNDIRTTLSGTNAELIQNVAVITEGKRHDDHHIEILHKSGHTNSSLTVNSSCSDRGHAIGTGLLMIEENCDGTDAGQVFKNLLLSDRARAESLPELEVLSDDVSAAHGAASSPIDQNQLHYLMARGFSPKHAKSLIVEGFLVSSFAKISNDHVRLFLLDSLNKHLNNDLEE